MQLISAKSANESPVPSSAVDTQSSKFDAGDDMAALRRLIIGPILQQQEVIEQRIGELQARLENPGIRSKECSQVIGAAIMQLHSDNKNLSSELEPEILEGMERGFRNQPDRMADALYPILGPAVRKLVASLFQRPQAELGKPYQVEQLFLIHKETSVILSEAFLYEENQRDADLVSGMLEAIRSFVKDAFALHEFDGMNSIELGDLKVWVEWGPEAVLAIVIRGFPEDSLREDYAEILSQIHIEFSEELKSFNGDNEPFTRVELGLKRSDEAQENCTVTDNSLITFPRLALAIFVGAMIMLAGAVSENRAWNKLVRTLSDEPGIVVVNAHNGWRQSEMTLLHDPLAAPVDSIIARSDIDVDKLRVKTHSFQSNDPSIVFRRLQVE